jgi:hypothetical protein
MSKRRELKRKVGSKRGRGDDAKIERSEEVMLKD